MKREKNKKIIILKEIIVVILTSVVTCVLTHYFSLNEIDYEHSLQIAENNLSEQDLLIIAQKYYAIEEYIKMLNVYELDKLETNPIALNNIAYMYEQGIVFEKDLSKAEEYYRKAAKLGNYEAMENWINFTICYPKSYDKLLEAIKYGYENNSYTVYSFLSEYIPENDDVNKRIELFFELPQYKIQEILELGMYTKEIDEMTTNYLGGYFTEKVSLEVLYHDVKKSFEVSESTLRDLKDAGKYVERISVEGEVSQAFVEKVYYQKAFLYSKNYAPNFINMQQE